MKTRLLTPLFLLFATFVQAAEVELKIKCRYLNFPISHQTERRRMTLSVKDGESCTVEVRLAEGEADYWTFRDVEAWKGKKITISYDGSEKALGRIYQADTIAGENQIYHEVYRPQYHFTTRRGWINDPNGLIFHRGKYHMFYQHNPYEREWGNMHWGHTVSTDLLHWQEQPLALHPDHLGTMFSGTAVIDYENTSGFAKSKKNPPLVVFYTADRADAERQCMAYSLDEGKTFTKYAGNPVVESHEKWQSHDTRDPKVFWHKESGHWVMVLNERDGHSFYTSPNLKDWTFESHITGFWECPDFFELPVLGEPDVRKWVLWGASGTYMIGTFDGRRFTPETSKLCNLNGSAYAAQTFANIPAEDGRVIKMAWGRIGFDDMPFNGCMLLPQEQILVREPSGLRLLSRPVKETEALFHSAYKGTDLSAAEANEALKAFDGNDALRMRATLHLTYATDAGVSYRGQRLVTYDMNHNRLNGDFYAPEKPGDMTLDVDIYIDRGMVEVYVDGGRFSYSMKRDVKSRNPEPYTFWGNQLRIDSLEVFKAESIWEEAI